MRMKMSDKIKQDRPREKLQARGVTTLSDFELLQAVVGGERITALVNVAIRIPTSIIAT
jgi:DNA repair protein RadC